MTLQRITGDILHVLKVWKIRSSEKKYTSEVNNLFEEKKFKESHKYQFTDYYELVDASSEMHFSMISTSHSFSYRGVHQLQPCVCYVKNTTL